jgi:hypothetical protein
VPEALRAKEDLAMQDYIVGWTQGLWDHINQSMISDCSLNFIVSC